MRTAASRMNYDRYCLLPEDGYQYEVFDGELVMTPAPTPRHQEIIVQLTLALGTFVQERQMGKVYIAPIDLVLDEFTILQPDLLFIRTDRLDIVHGEAIEGAPDLVVEVLSRSTLRKDRVRKLAAYSEFGVLEYWIADPGKQKIELFERSGDELRLSRVYGLEEILESRLLPGFQLPLKRVF